MRPRPESGTACRPGTGDRPSHQTAAAHGIIAQARYTRPSLGRAAVQRAAAAKLGKRATMEKRQAAKRAASTARPDSEGPAAPAGTPPAWTTALSRVRANGPRLIQRTLGCWWHLSRSN